MYKKPLLISILLGTVFLLKPASVLACGCYQRPTVLHDYERSDAVLIGRAISVNKGPTMSPGSIWSDLRSATVSIQKVFKGNLRPGEQISFAQGNGIDCLWTFGPDLVGGEYLFYLFAPSDASNLWFVYGCGRSTSLEDATDDLLYLNNMEKVRGKTRISGIYRSLDEDVDDFGVKDKKIQLVRENKVYETRTDSNGVYEFYDLPPGKYELRPEMPQGWKIALPEMASSPSYFAKTPGSSKSQIAFTLQPKKHAGLDLLFKVDNVVSGSVYDSKGKLVTDACPSLVPLFDEKQVRGDETCKNGHFKIESAEAGDYLLVLNQSGKKTIRDPYPTLYYPSVTERKKAGVIKIAAGQSLKGLKMIVPEMESMITVTGVVRYADNRPAAGRNVAFKASELPDIDGKVVTHTDAAGRFSMKLFKGLRGELTGIFVFGYQETLRCPGLKDLYKEPIERRSTPAIRLDAEHNVNNLVLRFPFGPCPRRGRRAP